MDWYSRKTVSSSIHNTSNHTTALSQDTTCNSSLEVLPIWSHRILKRYLLNDQDLIKIMFMTSTFLNQKCTAVKNTMTIGTTQCYWRDSAVWPIVTLVPSDQMTQQRRQIISWYYENGLGVSRVHWSLLKPDLMSFSPVGLWAKREESTWFLSSWHP